MTMEDLQNSDARKAAELIMDAIVTQKLAPSQKVSENIFSEMFGISRTISRNLITTPSIPWPKAMRRKKLNKTSSGS